MNSQCLAEFQLPFVIRYLERCQDSVRVVVPDTSSARVFPPACSMRGLCVNAWALNTFRKKIVAHMQLRTR